MKNFNDGRNSNNRPNRNFKNNNDRPRRNTGNNNENNDRANRIQELISKQEKNLDVIEAAVSFLDGFAAREKSDKLGIADLLKHLKTNGFDQEHTKAISQINYMLVELANAQRNSYISSDRIDIRVKYIKERFITSYRRELYGRIDKLFADHPLFKVDYSNDVVEEAN
jgi:hypothetical protein